MRWERWERSRVSEKRRYRWVGDEETPFGMFVGFVAASFSTSPIAIVCEWTSAYKTRSMTGRLREKIRLRGGGGRGGRRWESAAPASAERNGAQIPNLPSPHMTLTSDSFWTIGSYCNDETQPKRRSCDTPSRRASQLRIRV